MEASGRTLVWYILKENRGRKCAYVTCADNIKHYECVCFLHDKKEHSEEVKRIQNCGLKIRGET